MSFDKEEISEKINKSKDSAKIKREKRILNFNEKKTETELKFKEKKLEIQQKHYQKKLDAHINRALAEINETLDDADLSITVLLEQVEMAVEIGDFPVDLIIFKAENLMEEILLSAQLRIQTAKNELIANLQQDLIDGIELATIEENISEVKDRMETVVGTLEGKIESEKEEFKNKYGE